MTAREDTIRDFSHFLVLRASHGNQRAFDVFHSLYLKTIAGYCYDAEQAGQDVEKYVRRKCRMNPLMWLALFNVVVEILKLWIEWRKPKETWGQFPVLKRGGAT
jgi:hypothetical protein